MSQIVVKIVSVELVLLGVLSPLDISHICGSFLNPTPPYLRSNLWIRNDYPNRAFLSDDHMYSVLE